MTDKEHAAIEENLGPIHSSTVRPEVSRFAIDMEAKLAANEHKGGWDQSPLGYLFQRLEEVVDEAKAATHSLMDSIWASEPGDSIGDLDAIGEVVIAELADVGNFAMMIAERIRSKSVGGMTR